jgi:transposase-like protein
VSRMRGFPQWRWHVDEVYVRINGEMVYLWRAVDHEGEVLESYVTKTRDKSAALRLLKKALKRHGKAETIVTGYDPILRRCVSSATKTAARLAGISTTGQRTVTCHSGDESEQCCASGK